MTFLAFTCGLYMYFLMSMSLTPLCLNQGNENKVSALEKKLDELKAENKPLGSILRQVIQAVCAEEVGFVWIRSFSHI